jgi:hypothetical protein
MFTFFFRGVTKDCLPLRGPQAFSHPLCSLDNLGDPSSKSPSVN